MDPFIGEMLMFAGNFEPRGWMFCDGRLLPISAYSTLFSILGTTYGGDGRTTFALPDLRGRVAMHQGQGPGLTRRQLGGRMGTETNTLNIMQMPSHSHLASTANLQAQMPAFEGTGNKSEAGPSKVLADIDNGYSTTAPNTALQGGAVTGTVSIGNAGGGQSVNNMQPSLVVNFIIAIQGVFPSRS